MTNELFFFEKIGSWSVGALAPLRESNKAIPLQLTSTCSAASSSKEQARTRSITKVGLLSCLRPTGVT